LLHKNTNISLTIDLSTTIFIFNKPIAKFDVYKKYCDHERYVYTENEEVVLSEIDKDPCISIQIIS